MLPLHLLGEPNTCSQSAILVLYGSSMTPSSCTTVCRLSIMTGKVKEIELFCTGSIGRDRVNRTLHQDVHCAAHTVHSVLSRRDAVSPRYVTIYGDPAMIVSFSRVAQSDPQC